MQVAQRIAGYSLGQADMLRRAMGKKKREIINKEKAPFIAGAVKNGFKEADADRIYEILVPFADYGFNKSHAAAYSVVAYQTAYLKANFPAEFMAAKLTNEITGTDSLPAYIDEARKMGIALDPPDINHSDRYFSVTEGRIVYGFWGIKGLGEGPADEIIACRKDGRYRDFMDFLERVNIKTTGRKVVELLIQTGAFDAFGVSRATLAFNMEQAIEYVQKNKDGKQFGQTSLFGDTLKQTTFRWTEKPEWTRMEKLRIEKDLIGFYFSGHPMDDFKTVWERYSTLDLARAEQAEDGIYTLVGIIKELKPHQSGNGEIGFSNIADYNGDIELVFFADAWAKCKNNLALDRVVALRGRLNSSETRDRPSIVVDSVLNLEKPGLSSEAIETYFSHPLDPYRAVWDQNCDLNLAQVFGAKDGVYTIVGIIRSLKPYQTAKGEMSFSSIEDFNGQIDLVLFSDNWEKYRNILAIDKIVALKGRLDKSRRPDKPSVIVNEILDLEKMVEDAKANPKPCVKKVGGKKPPEAKKSVAPAKAPAAVVSVPAKSAVHIRLLETATETDEPLYILRDTLLERPGPCAVFIHVPADGGETLIRTTSQIGVSVDILDTLTRCSGVAEAWTE